MGPWDKSEIDPANTKLERGIDGAFKVLDILLTLACMIGVGVIAWFMLGFVYSGFAHVALTILAALVIGGLLRLLSNLFAYFG